MSVAIGYLCPLIMGLENEGLCKFLSIILSVVCFVEMKYLLPYHMDPVIVSSSHRSWDAQSSWFL